LVTARWVRRQLALQVQIAGHEMDTGRVAHGLSPILSPNLNLGDLQSVQAVVGGRITQVAFSDAVDSETPN